MKKKSGMTRLLAIAGERRGLVMLSCVLSALSAALMLVPFLSVYRILGELLARGAGPENAAFFGRQALIAFGAIGVPAVFQGANQLPVTRHPLPADRPGKGEEDSTDKKQRDGSNTQIGHIFRHIFST